MGAGGGARGRGVMRAGGRGRDRGMVRVDGGGRSTGVMRGAGGGGGGTCAQQKRDGHFNLAIHGYLSCI